MDTPARHPDTSPRTQWAFPPHWDEHKPCVFSDMRPSPDTPSHEAILELLLDDMCRGHLNVAIRHFLMLRETGAAVPALIERSCEQLVDRCDPGRLREIRRQVQAWHRMVSPPAGAH